MNKKNKIKNKSKEIKNNNHEGNFIYHTKELRKRLIFCIYAIFISFCISYYNLNKVILFVTSPLLKYKGYIFIATSVTETFSAYIELSLIFAFGISTPFIMWQIYLFLEPALFNKEKKWIIGILVSFISMFSLGLATFYYLILPRALQFLVQYKNPKPILINMQISISQYISMVSKMFIGFGLAMQIPLLLVILVHIKVITVNNLVKFRKYSIVIIFIIAGIITPPDIPSQIIVGVILSAMYEIPILVNRYLSRNQNKVA